jgi:hypothetical protein
VEAKSDKDGAKQRRRKVVYKEYIQRKWERISEKGAKTEELVTTKSFTAQNAYPLNPRFVILTEELINIQVF